MLAAQAPIGLGDVQIGLPLANEIGNSQITDDAAFNSQVAALQNAIAKNAEPQNIDKAVSDLVATAGQVAQVQKPQTVSADDLAAIQALQVDLDAAIQEKIQAKVDDAYSLETKLSDISKSVDPTNSFATLASLSKKIGEDYKDFSSKPIDVNELKFTNKLVGAEHSKLEAQIKHLDAEQFIQRSPIEQVKVKISQGIEMGMDRISIKLHPAELGKVDVDLDLDKDGKTHVRIVADRSETLDFLRRDSGELQKALRELGVYNDDSNLQFSLNQNGQNGENGTDNQAKNSNYKAASDEYSALTQPLSEAEVNLVINHGGLNIMV
jgi:flagellar hook-length control protein FliK